MSGFAIFSALIIAYGVVSAVDSTPKNNTYKRDLEINRQEKYRQLYRKYDNMTDFQMKEKMKDWLLWDEYKDYSKEYKIQRLVQKENDRYFT